MAVQASRRKRILQAIVAQLATITEINGFATNAGDHIQIGDNPTLGPDDPVPCISVLVGDDTVGNQQAKIVLDLAIQIAVIVPADAVNAVWMQIEDVISDVKRAMELADRTLGGLLRYHMQRLPTRVYPRESGSTVAGVIVSYNLPYAEVWGEPES